MIRSSKRACYASAKVSPPQKSRNGSTENQNVIDFENSEEIFAFSSFHHSANTTVAGTANQSIINRKSMSNRDSMDFASKYGATQSLLGGMNSTFRGSTKKQTSSNWNHMSPSVNGIGMSK